MRKFTGFEKGMGIGGWLTNYKRFHVLPEKWRGPLTVGDFEHFATYITEADVINIKSMGLDHIRVGFDQVVVEESPYVYREVILEHIDNFISWCKKHQMNVVLNLHKALGNYCDIEIGADLMDDEELQNRFVKLWVMFEQRYHNDNSIAFEILNEVRDRDSKKWNVLVEKTVNAIRELNKERIIIIGSALWNNNTTLKLLPDYKDEKIIYTFHTYEPFEFTHQRGVLVSDTLFYNRKMPYPCDDIERYRDFHRVVHGIEKKYPEYDKIDINFLRDIMQPAVDFAKANPDKIVWCGEFGSIRHADITWRENYMRDLITILKENDMPYCVWNYLSTPNDGNKFSLVDDDTRKILSERMAQIIRGEV